MPRDERLSSRRLETVTPGITRGHKLAFKLVKLLEEIGVPVVRTGVSPGYAE